MKQWVPLLVGLVLMVLLSSLGATVWAQPSSSPEHYAVSIAADQRYGSDREQDGRRWEESSEGIAYSEFNHRFVGLFVLLFGFSELAHALRYAVPLWIRLVLPSALGVIGGYLLVWSDHEAWPIGSLTFAQTFFGQDQEILQHKFYGVFSSTAAVSETLLRLGWARHPAWTIPLVFLGMVGGLLLFVHSHGDHPASHTIGLHHTLLGSLGVGAALSKAMASWMPGSSPHLLERWEVAWAVCVILMGIQLLLYFE